MGQQKKLWGFLKKTNLLWNYYYIPTKKADQLIQFTTKTKPLIFFTSKFTSVYSTWINKARTRVPPISGPSHMLNKKAVENYCTNSENWYLKGVTQLDTLDSQLKKDAVWNCNWKFCHQNKYMLFIDKTRSESSKRLFRRSLRMINYNNIIRMYRWIRTQCVLKLVSAKIWQIIVIRHQDDAKDIYHEISLLWFSHVDTT